MAIRRTTSESVSSMSYHDQEVERRLKSLEDSLKQVQSSKPSQSSSNVEERLSNLEKKLDTLVSVLKVNPYNAIEKLSKGIL